MSGRGIQPPPIGFFLEGRSNIRVSRLPRTTSVRGLLPSDYSRHAQRAFPSRRSDSHLVHPYVCPFGLPAQRPWVRRPRVAQRAMLLAGGSTFKIGRASCREREVIDADE